MSFVDHLQLLPVPARGGRREPDGDHRPGGLGTRTLAERLEARGWTARIEDIGFEKPVPERRIMESYARAISDGVESAWDRSRFPILVSRVNHGATGVVDALGPRTGVVWASPAAAYARPGRFRKGPLEDSALALLTGRAGRDALAIRPSRVPASAVVLLGTAPGDGRDALAADGARLVAGPADLPAAVAAIDAEAWYVHVDAAVLAAGDAPAADDPGAGGVSAEALADAIAGAFAGRPIRCLGIARYDLNRDPSEATAASFTRLIEAAARAAGGQPRAAAAVGTA